MKTFRSVLVCASILSSALVTACSGVGSMTSDAAVEQEALGVDRGDATAGADLASVAKVNVKTSLGVLSPIAVGANAAAWDGDLVDRDVPRLLEDAGVQLMRYPGGSLADNYHWLSNQPDDPNVGGTDPAANFDAFMAVVDRVGARAMITVNYGSGTAEEAADWVRYANRGCRRYEGPVPTYPGASASGHAYGIRYWEIGNEVYGDGIYGATWEVNHKSHDPSTYANGVVSYATAMKAVDRPFASAPC
jgi:alpha-L-arabinofuranosidase